MLRFKLKRNHNGKKSRWVKKYPRKKIENTGEGRKAIKVVNWYNKNWIDDNPSYFPWKEVTKFLKSNIGKPIDKVFSEFISRCDKSVKSYNLKKEFYAHIENKKDIISNFGGFYITNGILNYKERTNNNFSSGRAGLFSDYIKYNINHFPAKNKIISICSKATKEKKPQVLGKLYINNNIDEKTTTVYVEDSNYSNLLFMDCTVIGFGNGIDIRTYLSQYKCREYIELLYCQKTPKYKFVIKWKQVK